MTFDATYQGAIMQMYNGVVYTQRTDGAFAAAYADFDRTVQVTLTGYCAVSPRGNTHYQTTSGEWIYLPDGWEKVGQVSVMQYSQAAAQALVDKIIRNNETIICGNLLCARYAHLLTEQQRETVRTLQKRLQTRNEALQAGNLVTDVQTSYPAGYAEFAGCLDKLMSGEQVGLATWVVVVIAATVIAATATAAYFAYKNLADESERDVKFSKELTATLAQKLTPEEYQQLLDETKGIVTKAKIRQMFSSYGNVIKIAALAVAGYAIYKYVKKNVL